MMTRNIFHPIIFLSLGLALTMFMFIEANSEAATLAFKVSLLFYCKSPSTWMTGEINSVVAVKTSNINMLFFDI